MTIKIKAILYAFVFDYADQVCRVYIFNTYLFQL